MGYVFEHLIRKFYEDANATAGEHFTPREVIHLMVNLLIAPDKDTISGEGQVINILDPACGTGGMLTTAEDKIKAIQPERTGLSLGPGNEPPVMGDLRVGDAAARPARLDLLRQLVQQRRVPGRDVRLHAGQPAVRRGVEDGQEGDRGREERPRLRGPVRRGAAADQRRVVPVPAAHDLQDGAGRAGRAAAWRSSSTAPRCSPARRSPASRRSAGGSWRTTGWRASSRCRTSSSTTPGSPPTSGS